MITELFAQHFRTAQRYFRRERAARSITALAFLLIIAGLALGIYALFTQGLAFIATFPESRAAVSLYMYELTLLTVAGLMFASALISGISRMFQGSFDFWIMASPSYGSQPWYTFLTIFLSSLWPLIVIGIPALAAIHTVFHISIAAFVISLIALVLLGVFVIACALSIIIGAAWSICKIGIKKTSAALVVVVIFIFATGATIFWHEIRGISDAANLFPGIASPTTEVVSAAKVAQQFLYFPTHPAAEVFFAAEQGTLLQAFFFFIIILTLASMGVLIFFALSQVYLPLWQIMQERGFEAQTIAVKKRAHSYAFASSNPFFVLFEKEALTFFRNQSGILWLGFLGLVWLLQVGFDVIISRNAHAYATAVSTLPPAIQVLQVVVITYFISMFVLRFVFPSFSTEKDTAWLLGSIPISLMRVYTAKLFFYTVLFILLSGAVVGLHSLILAMPFLSTLVLFILIACMTTLIVLFGLSLGVFFPNFESTDPEQLSTSLPGLAFIVCSLAYGGFGAIVFRAFLMSGSLSMLAVFILVSASAFGILTLLSIRTLRHFEFGF